MTDSRAFYRTTITVTVLSEGYYDPTTLREVDYDITDGDCSGVWQVTASSPITAEEMQQALKEQGSDPSVFGLGEEEEEGLQHCCVCSLPAEGAEQVCACTCPECGTHIFDDLILSNRGRCWDCWKQWQLRPEQIAQEAQAWTTHRCEEEER